jgi:hypothetical protein
VSYEQLNVNFSTLKAGLVRIVNERRRMSR